MTNQNAYLTVKDGGKSTIIKCEDFLEAFYYFSLVPYFEDFWTNTIMKNPKEFSGIGLLMEKGLPLIDKTPPEKRIAKIFQVLNEHLSLQLTSQTEAFIFGDS